MSPAHPPTLQLEILHKSIRERNGNTRVLFEQLRFALPTPGCTTAIMGRSGSGKTTLLRILAGLDNVYTGSYWYAGQRLSLTDAALSAFRRTHIGYVTQSYQLLTDRNVSANVRLGAPKSSAADAAALLERVGLPGYDRKRVTQLSGGESQRVAIARALIKNPSVLLADEPTGSLDTETETTILDVIHTFTAQGTAVVFASHSTEVARRCDRVFHLTDLQLQRSC